MLSDAAGMLGCVHASPGFSIRKKPRETQAIRISLWSEFPSRSGKFDFVPVCSADSKTALYADADSKIEKVGIDGGVPQQLREYANFGRITVSPDGKIVAMITNPHR